MTTRRNPDVLYLALCCALDAVAQEMTDNALYVPPEGGPTHKGEEEAVCPEGLWAWWDNTAPNTATFGPGTPCEDPKDRTLAIALAYQLCTEDAEKDGCDDRRCAENGECYDVDIIAPGQCQDGEQPTFQAEAATIYRARYILELFDPKCCFGTECVPLRCESTAFLSQEYTVEGGVAYIVTRWTVRW